MWVILIHHVKCMGYFDSPCKMYHLILTPKKRHRIWHICQYHNCNILPFDLEGILHFWNSQTNCKFEILMLNLLIPIWMKGQVSEACVGFFRWREGGGGGVGWITTFGHSTSTLSLHFIYQVLLIAHQSLHGSLNFYFFSRPFLLINRVYHRVLY